MHETTQSILRSEVLMKELEHKIRPSHEVLCATDAFMNQLYYTIDDFLYYDDQEFILYLYLGILKRHPDTKGLNQWLTQLKEGKKTKKEIVSIVRYSEEGIHQNVMILGLLAPQNNTSSKIKPFLEKIKPIS